MREWMQVEAAARELRAAVEAALRRRELSPRLRERVEMVKAVALGYGTEAIATWSGRSDRTVRFWLVMLVRAGLTGLADAPGAGRPPRGTPTYLAALETMGHRRMLSALRWHMSDRCTADQVRSGTMAPFLLVPALRR